MRSDLANFVDSLRVARKLWGLTSPSNGCQVLSPVRKALEKKLPHRLLRFVPLESRTEPFYDDASLKMPALTISARVMGKRKPLVPDWQVPWPPEGQAGGEPLTLRQLITRVVLREVEAFKQRQEERRLARILTEPQIEEGMSKGRVDSGGRELLQWLDADTAVATALQAFEDGIYLVILDDEEQRELDREVHLQPDSHLVFLRLVMLAGA